jgi:hypothetical protein
MNHSVRYHVEFAKLGSGPKPRNDRVNRFLVIAGGTGFFLHGCAENFESKSRISANAINQAAGQWSHGGAHSSPG